MTRWYKSKKKSTNFSLKYFCDTNDTGTAHPLLMTKTKGIHNKIESTLIYCGWDVESRNYTSAKHRIFREKKYIKKSHMNGKTVIRANTCVHLAWRQKQHEQQAPWILLMCAILNGYCHSMSAFKSSSV